MRGVLGSKMLDFNFKQPSQVKPTKNYFNRRTQRRLLLFVMLMGIPVIALDFIDWSQFFEELFAPPKQSSASASQADEIPPQPKYYDTRIRPQSNSELPSGIFMAQVEKPKPVDPSKEFFPGVDPTLLADVQDFSPFRHQENPAWFNLLGVLKETDESELVKASQGRVGFVQLYEQMDIYRGQLLTVEGVVKRAFDVHAPKNDKGIEKYYQLWLFPKGGPISPIVIYCLELPEDFPQSRGENDEIVNINANVKLTGFAFKDWIYGTENRIESAPLLLAKSLTWEKPKPVEAEQPLPIGLIGGVVLVTAIAAIAFTCFVYFSSNRMGTKNQSQYGHISTFSAEKNAPSDAEVGATLERMSAESGQSGTDFASPGSESSEEDDDPNRSSQPNPSDENLS